MKKFTILLFLIIVTTLFIRDTYAQGFTPPKVIIGLSLDGNFATNDAHGTNFTTDPNVYGMIWGRGLSLYTKIGMGIRKNHRITISATYNKMINTEDNNVPFLTVTPSDPLKKYTNYNIWSGALGYEYAFNPRCKSKQYLGFAVTANYLTCTQGSYAPKFFDPAFRIGAQISTGYEFVLDKNFKYGLSLGLKYNLENIIGKSNGVIGVDLNDGPDVPGPTFWRRIGVLSINIGFNFYTGVEPYRGIK
jgi:hypothetical protein